jgi:hypothetical protein
MERYRAEGYAVGGWRSAALEVGGIGMRADDTRLRQGYGAARRTEDRDRGQNTEDRRQRTEGRF